MRPCPLNEYGMKGDIMIRLGTRLELFVDDYLIDSMRGTALQAHEPRRENVALAMDKPWEGGFVNYGTVIRDGGRFLMYYRGWRMVNREGIAVYCLAESSDGIRWSRMELALNPFGRQRKTNIFLADCKATHSFSPFIDTRPGCPKKERFKALGLVPSWMENKADLGAYASADGVHWRLMQEKGVIPRLTEDPHAFDSQNVAFWSETEKCYVSYFRTWRQNQRRISRATNVSSTE